MNQERYGLTKKRNKNPDIEDKMDEMFYNKIEEEERLRQLQFDKETGGYSDIDVNYAKKKHNENEL